MQNRTDLAKREIGKYWHQLASIHSKQRETMDYRASQNRHSVPMKGDAGSSMKNKANISIPINNLLYSSMEEGFCDRHWELVESQVVKPFRRYKAMRNNSMPDLCDLAGTPSPAHAAERQFAYNKWFIRPEQRLKRKPVGLRSSLQLHPAAPLFYESLYSLDELSLRPPEETREKEAALRRICADGQNLKLLATFRNRKQQHSKRVPAVVDYVIDFQRRDDLQTRDRLIKRSKRCS